VAGFFSLKLSLHPPQQRQAEHSCFLSALPALDFYIFLKQ